MAIASLLTLPDYSLSSSRRAGRAYRAAVALLLGVPLVVAPVAARAQDSTRTSVAHVPVITERDATRTGLILLAAAAVAPFDGEITRATQRPSWHQHRALEDVAHGLNAAGGPGLVVVPIAAWAAGRLGHDAPLATTAVRTAEAIALGAAVSGLAKGVIGRARPYAVADSNAAVFRPGRGFTGREYTSFPSGHATAAWATATMLDAELHTYWPHGARVAVPIAYTGAALVSLARIYTDQHWTSDVIAGAAVGTLAARMVIHYHRDHPRNLVDRTFLSGGVAAVRGIPVTVISVAW